MNDKEKKRNENILRRIINTHAKSFNALFTSSSLSIQGAILLCDSIQDTENAFTVRASRILNIERNLSCNGLKTLKQINEKGRVI